MGEPQPSKDAFAYKLDLLTKEIETVQRIIDKFDQMTQTGKNWAVTLWAGTLAVLLQGKTHDVSALIFATPIVPFLFWTIDVIWRRHQNRALYRDRRISAFVNSPAFEEACRARDFGSFIVWDPIGTQYVGQQQYHSYVSWSRIMRFRSLSAFYLSLTAISIILGVIKLHRP